MSKSETTTIKKEYDFGYTKISFNLTERDWAHVFLHATKMKEWSGSLLHSVGASLHDAPRGFPFYSFRCRECDYRGDDYEKNGEPRT